ncbi:MAG: ABC transporter permease [Verrucomicrobia bacterium]|nr:ABC transporter permease [Verrucomicrobiota bacterium]
MDDISRGLTHALQLIVSADPAVMQIIFLSLEVTGLALVISTLIGVPLGAIIGLSSRARARGFITVLLYTGMGLPPVVVGLVVYLLLSRSGPIGALGWLFTPAAMIAAQIIIALPLVTGLTMAAVQSVDPNLRLQMRSLGATRWQETRAVLREARIGVIAAIVAAFGGIISEVGAVMLVGGNIEGKTRVLTTAIVLDTRMGEFDAAIALGIILLALAFVANAALFALQRRAGD